MGCGYCAESDDGCAEVPSTENFSGYNTLLTPPSLEELEYRKF